MDVAAPMTAEDTANARTSGLLCDVARFLGGRMRWKGGVRGVFGLIDRTFVIDSDGRIKDGVLHFSERIRYADGVAEQRCWRVWIENGGLALKADGVTMIEPGRLSEKKLELAYQLKLGGIRFEYKDVFEFTEDGAVVNRGVVTFLGVPIMKVDALGVHV